MKDNDFNFGPPLFDETPYLPFRKRRPFIFWPLLIFLALFGCYMFVSLMQAMSDNMGSGSFISGKQIGVINVEGVIMDSKDVVEWTEKLSSNDNVLGVLVRVNSPGGAVTPSEEIYFAIKRLAEKKPVVVSMGTLAASGGYMISLPARHIVASPSTITGSIGTRMDMANWAGLMEKIGIKDQSLASGRMKDAGSPYRDLNDEERAYFMGLLTDMHEQFADMVGEARKLNPKELKAVADGRAFTGRQALDLKLVDSLGDRYEALQILHVMTNYEAKDSFLLEGPIKKRNFMETMFEGMFRAMHNAQMNAATQSPFYYF